MQLDFPKTEEEILKLWKKKKVFEKSLDKTKKGQRFVFYEGPPFANGLPGIHHLLARAFKDVILRYKTMQGFHVERRAGWDTHGLPTETEAEKKLNIKSKREIEDIGIDKFIDECRNNVFTYKKQWEEFTERIGFWLDFEKAYITCSNDYIESEWWILKQVWDKKLLYQDYKVVPYCPRCGTSLSSHEVAQGYKTVKENSIYVKFPVKGEKNTYILVWTTTPWTLPGNVAIAVNKKFTYVKVKVGSEYLILVKDRLSILDDYKIVEEIKGKELLGLEYEPLFDFIKPDKKSFYVISGDFISAKDGTGLVHIAPAFGEDDLRVGKENNLPVLITVDEEGKYKKAVTDWEGMFVIDTNPLIIENLKKRKPLFKEEEHEHEYPFCWRCKTPLIYYAKNSWFIKMTEIKNDLIKNSKDINWVPDHIKNGRFGDWIKDVKDWNLSRERYWGTPLPIWQCKECNKQICVESIKELKERSGKKIKDLHRPLIDEIIFKCECGSDMKRVPEVIDCWFDSGSMPFAQWHYPFENKEKIDKGEAFPADYIAEGIDQTRGWFYTLLAISTLLGKGISYRNVVSLGLVLDNKGQKMSKSKGNIVVPNEAINKFGADCVRFYFYTVNQVGETKRFNFKEVQDLHRKVFDTLWQSYTFFSLYNKGFKEKEFKSKDLLDKWIVSKLENLNLEVIKNLDEFDIVSAARLFEDFIDDMSNWYIRRSRRRFQKPETKEEKEEASQTLYYVLLKLSKLIAPFAPFISEELYQRLNGEEQSIHLSNYPEPDKKLIDNELEKNMIETRETIVSALAQRAEHGIKVRQPLQKLEIKKTKLEDGLLDLIKQEVNVKEVSFGKGMKLDINITEELKKEGNSREFVRSINSERKKKGFTPEDTISISSTISEETIEKEYVIKETKAKKFETGKKDLGSDKKEITIDNKKEYFIIK